MLKVENRFDDYAYRAAQKDLADPSASIMDGSWITLDTSGKIIVSDGTKKSFLSTTSNRDGRDLVHNQGVFPKGTYLYGAYEVTVENTDGANVAFDGTKTYAPMTALKVVKDATTKVGILTPVTGTGTEIIEAYAVGNVVNNTLRIMSA